MQRQVHHGLSEYSKDHDALQVVCYASAKVAVVFHRKALGAINDAWFEDDSRTGLININICPIRYFLY